MQVQILTPNQETGRKRVCHTFSSVNTSLLESLFKYIHIALECSQEGQTGYQHKSYNREELEYNLLSAGPLFRGRDSTAKSQDVSFSTCISLSVSREIVWNLVEGILPSPSCQQHSWHWFSIECRRSSKVSLYVAFFSVVSWCKWLEIMSQVLTIRSFFS